MAIASLIFATIAATKVISQDLRLRTANSSVAVRGALAKMDDEEVVYLLKLLVREEIQQLSKYPVGLSRLRASREEKLLSYKNKSLRDSPLNLKSLLRNIILSDDTNSYLYGQRTT